MKGRRKGQAGEYGLSRSTPLVNLRVSLIQMSAFFSFCVVFLGVYLIKKYVPFASIFQLVLAAGAGLIFLYYCCHHKLLLPSVALILLFDAGLLLLVSLFKGQSFGSYLAVLVPILVVISPVLMVRNRRDLLQLLEVWCTCMFTVVLIDLGTMILWPNGMYQTRYPINWFLGYKTHRLEYSFTLMILYTCYSLLKYDQLKKSVFWLSLLVVADTYLSYATAATLAVAAYAAGLFFLRNEMGKKHSSRLGRGLMYLLKRYRLAFGIYLVITLLIVVINDTNLMLQIATILHKSTTFSGRVKIWSGAAEMARNNLLWGSGVLSASQYSDALDFNNPHNMMYTYVITGGIVGTAILFLAIGKVFSLLKENSDMFYIGLYVYCVFILGFVSSTMSFSPFFFAILMLAPVLKRVEQKTT